MTRWLSLFAALALCVSCSSPLSGTIRILSRPDGAKVTMPERGNLQLITPAEFDGDVEPEERIVVTKEGYVPYDGPLGDLPRVADNTYEVSLEER